MKIIGPDFLVFGVDDLGACQEYLRAFGLDPVEQGAQGGTYLAQDGTGVIVRRRDDPSLPPALSTGNTLRQQVYGVAGEADLEAIAAELGRDRQIDRQPDGSFECQDDLGFSLKFQISVRKPLDLPVAENINAPGAVAGRGPNEVAVSDTLPARPRTLSHVVLFVPDQAKATAFYCERLGFRVTDLFTDTGPFLRPGGNDDHHTLFFIQTPPFMQGCEHLAFHMGGPTEVLLAGTRFVDAGYQSFWGPGRHRFGSNWFWYFNSPFGCHFEYDADMDKHDDAWQPREAASGADASQIMLFQHREKWFPSGGPPPGAGGTPPRA